MWEDVIKIAGSYAQEYCSDAIYPSHLFKAILHKDSGMVRFLEVDMDKDYYFMQQWADVQMQLSPRASRPMRDLELSPQGQAVIDEAEDYISKFELEQAENVCLLASLVTPGVGFTFDELKTLPLSASEIAARYGSSSEANVEVAFAQTKNGAKAGASQSGAIQKYCINKNEMAQNGELGVVIGFDSELLSICEILGRKTKSNLLISGENGVGKSALVDGFAHRLVSGQVPWFLSGYVLYELDLALLGSDASYKGEVEDRFKKVITEIQQSDNAILLIESIDKIFDKQSSLFGASTILKQELNKGNLMLLATCSIDGFTKNIETDKEFVGKIEKMTIDEPNADMALRILSGSISAYSEYHKLGVEQSVLVEAIRVAKRYLTEKSLPDSAFDLIDRTMALVKTMNDLALSDVEAISEKLNQIESESCEQTQDSTLKQLDWLYYEMTSKVSCILLSQIDLDVDFSKIATVSERIAYLRDVLKQLAVLGEQKRDSLESSDLFAVVAKQTGIPMGKVQSKERDKLVGAEQTLKKRVIGQDHAVKIVLDAVFESRSGLSKKGQPMGSFFFLGPTGTGKTELSKALAAFLFEDQSSLIRFDMSEFKEEHSVALLYGAPPGYVGYEEGGLLVNKIRQKPYSVVLFDEIEKAHKSVFDLFLQILDEGKLHDRLGRVGDFSNALILFTSNIGSRFVVDQFEKGVIPKNSDLMDIMQEHFRPEFLGRLTEIVPFSPIMEATVVKIFDIHLKDVYRLLEEQNIELILSEQIKQNIAMKGYNPQYGARPIIGIIRKELRRPLSKLIIAGKVKSGDKVEVYLDGENVEFRTL